MTTDELACQQLVEFLSEHLDDTLAAEDQRRVVEHLSACDGCSAALEQVRATIRVAGTLAEDSVAEADRDRIRATFRSWQRAAPPSA